MDSIAVITICYNNLAELQLTCSSVDEQKLLPDEHWIIDGSTNKEIYDWLNGQPQPGYRKWISERDNGISDAFNKGIEKSTGTVTHLLNAGDTYYDTQTISIVSKHFEAYPQIKWLHSLYVQNRGGVDVITGAPFRKDRLWKGMRTVAHPTMFVKKELYNRYGLFNTSFKVAMDYDFLIRIRNEEFIFINKPLVYFAPGGTSNTQFHRGLSEVKTSYFKYIGNSTKLVLWQARQKLLNLIMQTGIGRALFKLKNFNKIAKLLP